MSTIVQQLRRAILIRQFKTSHLRLGFKQAYSFSSNSNNNASLQKENSKEEDVSLYALNNKIYEIHENAQLGTVVKAKGDVLFFTNFAKSAIKLRSLIQFQDEPARQAIVLSLNDKVSTALCLDSLESSQKYLDKNVQLVDKNGLLVKLNGKDIVGKIIDFRGNVVTKKAGTSQQEKQTDKQSQQSVNHNDFDVQFRVLDLSENEQTARLAQKRSGGKAQLYTGNISIDMSYPICMGNFVVLKGEVNTGKSYLAGQTILQACSTNSNAFGIYVTQNQVTAQKIHAQLTNSGNHNNFIVISPPAEEHAGPAARYLAPFTGIQLAKKLQTELAKDVVLVFDNVLDHAISERAVFSQVNMPSGFRSALKEIFTKTGCFGAKGGSISSLCIFDESSDSVKKHFGFSNMHSSQDIKIEDEACSYADVILEFDVKDNLLRQIKPKISPKGNKFIPAHPWQNALFRSAAKDLQDLLVKLQVETNKVNMQNDLKLTVEPWDYYLYFDSKYFMRLIVSANYFNPLEQAVFVKFIIAAIEEETIAMFKQSPQELTADFFAFAREFKQFNNQDIFTYFSSEMLRNDTHPNTIDNFHHAVRRLYELFIMHLKMSDKLLPFKKDYFS